MIVNTDGALYGFRKPIIKELILKKHQVVSISGESDYFDRLKDLGVAPSSLNFDRHSTSPLKNLKILAQLTRHVREACPDIVHNFTHKPAIYGTIAARLSGVHKIFVTVTGLGTPFIQEGLKASVLRHLLLLQYRIALLFADTVFFQNPDDLEYFVTRNILPKRKAVLTNGSGIDLEELATSSILDSVSARAMLSLELGSDISGKEIILFPARGVREKGFYEFYSAAKILLDRYPDKFVFLHLGLVDQMTAQHLSVDDIDRFAKENGVHYLGFKENILDYMSAADIVALPSYREGVPRSLIEALALGKVILTTDAPGCREVVKPGWNGYLFEPRSAEAFVNSILRVDSEMYSNSKKRSREFCEEKFDVRHLVELTLQHYFSKEA